MSTHFYGTAYKSKQTQIKKKKSPTKVLSEVFEVLYLNDEIKQDPRHDSAKK